MIETIDGARMVRLLDADGALIGAFPIDVKDDSFVVHDLTPAQMERVAQAELLDALGEFVREFSVRLARAETHDD
jgi:hypothetical protein